MCGQPSCARTTHLPTELWIAIFEQLSDPPHDVHILNESSQSRLDNTRELQKLQYVCKAWRCMIRPLTYRHIALTGLQSLKSPEDYSPLSFMYFLESWDLNKNARGRKTRWIETLILRHDRHPWSKEDGRFIGLLRNFLSHLTCLTQFACYTTLSAKDFELLVAASHGTLRKLLVDLSGDDIAIMLPALPRLRAIEDLSIMCELNYYSDAELPNVPDELLDLPNLRHLELYSTSVGIEFLLLWFLRLPPSNLKVFKITMLALGTITRELLSPFLTKHGANLETLSMAGAGFRYGSTDLLILTPKLKHLGLFANYESIAMFLNKLPAPVEEVTLSQQLRRLRTPWTLMADLFKWLEQLPLPNMLRVVRIAREMGRHERRPKAWRGLLENMDGTEEQLRKVVELMGRFEQLGIRVLDEEGLALEDYIMEQLETPYEVIRRVI